MTQVNPNNENETNIFPRDIFKSDATSPFIKKYQCILMTFKAKMSQFYHLLEPKQWTLNKIRSFPMLQSNSDIIFHWSQNTKTFQ